MSLFLQQRTYRPPNTIPTNTVHTLHMHTTGQTHTHCTDVSVHLLYRCRRTDKPKADKQRSRHQQSRQARNVHPTRQDCQWSQECMTKRNQCTNRAKPKSTKLTNPSKALLFINQLHMHGHACCSIAQGQRGPCRPQMQAAGLRQ